MRILIAGASGFVGSYLSEYLMHKGHRVIGVGRRSDHPLSQHDRFAYVSADTTLTGPWQDHIPEVEAIINLAGRNIFHYWTDASKRQMVESRILTTRNLVMALQKTSGATLVNASAIGYYGDRGDAHLKEDESAGNDFLADLSVAWEREALTAEDRGGRVALLRFAIILGREGGAFAKMLPPFRYFVGGPLGSGRQWFSWIHIQDLAAVVEMILANEKMDGAFNICAPHPVRNHHYAKALGTALSRPAIFRVPAFAIKMIMGELGGVMLGSQRCLPDRLQHFGFEFRYPSIDTALAELTQKRV
jgi:uncharacterized protein